jgi:hypothetical protein
VATPLPRPSTPPVPISESGAFSLGTCGNCGAQLTDSFCSHCGEKKLSPKDYSLAHLAEEALDGLTHFDTRFLRTLKLAYETSRARSAISAIILSTAIGFSIALYHNLLFYTTFWAT